MDIALQLTLLLACLGVFYVVFVIHALTSDYKKLVRRISWLEKQHNIVCKLLENTTPQVPQISPHQEPPPTAIAAALEHVAVAVEQSTQVTLGAEALQNKQLDIIKSLLDKQRTTTNGSQKDEPMNRLQLARKDSSKRVNSSPHLDLFAVRKYRKVHTIPETAIQFGVSESTIKRALKGGKT